MSKRIVITALVVATVLAATAQVASSSSSRTIRLDLPGTKSTYVDLNRKSYSPGDYFMSTGRLLDASTHKQVGRLGGVWTILSRAADNATFDLGLAGGTILVSGHIVHAAPKSVLAVTGGTGRYNGARGTVRFRYTSETTAELDVRLK